MPTKKVNRIVEILMKRDGMSETDARALYKDAKRAMYECIEDGDFEGAEDVLADYLGLEPDYIDSMLF